MASDPNPDATPDAQKAYSRLVQYSDRVFEAAEDLNQAGGIRVVAAGWTPKAVERAAAVLKAARDSIDAQLSQLKAVRRPRR